MIELCALDNKEDLFRDFHLFFRETAIFL